MTCKITIRWFCIHDDVIPGRTWIPRTTETAVGQNIETSLYIWYRSPENWVNLRFGYVVNLCRAFMWTVRSRSPKTNRCGCRHVTYSFWTQLFTETRGASAQSFLARPFPQHWNLDVNHERINEDEPCNVSQEVREPYLESFPPVLRLKVASRMSAAKWA